MTLNKAKYVFFKSQIEFCGYLIDAEGVHKSQEKIRAVSEAPTSQDVSQLRTFLGKRQLLQPFPRQSVIGAGTTIPVEAS